MTKIPCTLMAGCPLFGTIVLMEKQVIESENTEAGKKADRSRLGGLSINAFFIPVVVVLAALHLVVIGLMFSIFTESGKLSRTTQESSVYISEATSLLAGTSLLSETSNNFVLMPFTTTGEYNIGPLVAYSSEMTKSEHRGDQVLASFETYNVDEQVLEEMKVASQSANKLVEIQNHAIALVCAVYPLPDNLPLPGLQLPELTPEEAALPDDKKIELARTLMLDTEFGSNKSAVSENVNAAVGNIRAATGRQAQMSGQTIGLLRTLLTVSAVAIIAILIIDLALFYRFLIAPLGRFSRLIAQGDSLDDKHGLREVRVLANSYNGLLDRRNALEDILREAAETDALTGLSNRYSFQQDIVEDEDKGASCAVFVFDVDNLKTTNDTLGHAAGDDLIRRAAYCISTCFAATDDGKCYRMGGDEFTAVVKHLEEGEIPTLAQSFEKMQALNNVSISWGYAYSEAGADVPFRAMMDAADQGLYRMKEEAHQNGRHIDPDE